jgi:hypothetical protein
VTNPKTGERLLFGADSHNQLVLMADRKGMLRALNYAELTEKIAGADPRSQRLIAAGALSRLQGNTPSGPQAGLSDELSTWIVHAEGRRNPAALATSALALDTVVSSHGGKGAPDLEHVVRKLPMRPAGAQENSRQLDQILDDPKKSLDSAGEGARGLAQDQIEVVRLWVETLNILTDDDASANSFQRRLETAIQNRLFDIYALTKDERNFVRKELGRR